ncbi:MAG TPA: PHP domain-containing protein [Dermatophilaceae bacterium]|jgi:putative hydrolase|nr:PHP domain-containing protein [Dermatophilaceae bacterium]
MLGLTPLTAGVAPLDALRRIALLLERARAGTYRVQAFRTAATIVAGMPPADLQRRLTDGTLTEVGGIGPATAAVVSEAAEGELPAYLASLQDKHAGFLAPGGEELYAVLAGDLHAHSDWSDGGSSIQEMVLAAVELGQEWMALTDHSPRLKVARGLSAERLRQQIIVVDGINQALGQRFSLLKGIEVDILDDGSLDQDPALLDALDIVTASVHSKLRMPSAPMTARMITAVRNPRVNVLGHATGRLVEGSRGTRPQSEFDAAAVFAECAANNVAVEINSRPERCDPPDELIALALEAGCLFAIDSDAHAPGQLDMKAYGCERATRLGVPIDRIVTTWSAEDVIEWAHG